MKRFLAVLLVAVMLLSVLPATSMAASYATVVGGWLRLRSAPNFSASTITSYYTGTQVEILGSSGGWYKVQTPDGRTGYMYGNYLRMGGSVPSEGTAYVTSYNGYGVRLRTGPGTGYRIIRTYAVGTPVTVLERGTYWSRISIGGTVGYMMSQFLHFGSDYPDDSNVLCYATIWSSNGYGVRLRTGPSKSYSKIGVYSVGAAEGCRLGPHPRGQPCGLDDERVPHLPREQRSYQRHAQQLYACGGQRADHAGRIAQHRYRQL